LEDIGGSEFLVIVDKDVCTGKPLSIELSPYSFPPSRIGDGEMDALLVEIMPDAALSQYVPRDR
jgi:hypothetical protein